MRSRIIAATLALALTGSACAQSNTPTQPEALAPPVEPTAPPAPPAPPAAPGARGGPPGEYGAALAEQRAAMAQQRDDAARQREAAVTMQAAAASNEPFMFRTATIGWGQSDQPVVITTESISDEVEAELKEDLGVMHKLLGDETSRTGGDGLPRAMGIKVLSLALAEPTYIEGLGAVFNYRVSVPLAAGEGSSGAGTRPAPPSAWETAKRELTVRRGGEWHGFTPNKKTTIEVPPFDPARLDQLTSAVIKTLTEAKNMRHLKENDVVIVTLSGTDDAGKPLRMTLKARKSDIDQAAGGAMTPEAFAERVARRIG